MTIGDRVEALKAKRDRLMRYWAEREDCVGHHNSSWFQKDMATIESIELEIEQLQVSPPEEDPRDDLTG